MRDVIPMTQRPIRKRSWQAAVVFGFIGFAAAAGCASGGVGPASPMAKPGTDRAPNQTSTTQKPEASSTASAPVSVVQPPGPTPVPTPPISVAPPASSSPNSGQGSNGSNGAVLKLTQGKIGTADKDLAKADEMVRKCLDLSKGAGELQVKITISTSGFALSVGLNPKGQVSPESVQCVKKALRDASFGKPEGGGVGAAEGVFHL